MTPLMRTVWALFYKFLNSGIAFATGIITARYLGPTGRGYFTNTMTYVNYYSPVIGSFSEYMPYGINKLKHEAQPVFSAALYFCFLLSGLLFGVAILGTPWFL